MAQLEIARRNVALLAERADGAERARAEARKELQQAAEDLRVERRRYEALVQTTVTMRREGLEATVPPVPHDPVEDPLGPDIRAAINSRSDPLTMDRKRMEQHAKKLLKEGKDPKAIAALVLVGDDVLL